MFIRWILLTVLLGVSLWARVIPEYVTAWPKQVAVDKPDPVLGDKLVWEQWIYSERFAKRFKGFPQDQADQELKDSPIQAIALRIYKDNLWRMTSPNFPPQYTCNIDIYFNDSIEIPTLNQTKKVAPWMIYPNGIFASYEKLTAMGDSDKNTIAKSVPINANVKVNPVIFADQPLDGRYASFGVRAYIPHYVNGISILNLQAGIDNSVIGPKSSNGIFWFSLYGKLPYKNRTDSNSPRAVSGSYSDITDILQAGKSPEDQGYIRFPQSFYNITLPKVTLIKILNRCISARYSYEHPSVQSEKITKAYNDFNQWCEDAERNGQIFDPTSYLFQEPKKNGLSNIGF